MRIVMTVTGLKITSGVSVFVVETANQLAAMGHDVTILYKNRMFLTPDPRVKTVHGETLDEVGFVPDVVHVHALWAPFCVKAMAWCRQRGVPYVVSLHGCLMPHVFTRGWLKKQVFYRLFLRQGLVHAACLHATSDAEADVARRFCPNANVVVIPLGTHLPEEDAGDAVGGGTPTLPEGTGGHAGRVTLPRERWVLFLGRIGKEKGLEELVSAWASIDHAGWRLAIVGPDWLGYQARLERLIREKDVTDVVLPGAALGDEKDRWYRRADVFVLSSPMENFSAVVLDALAYGVPAIATTGTPWRELETARCGWWVAPGAASLASALRAAMSLDDDDRAAMGARGRALVAARYQWPAVARSLLSAYSRCCR